MNTTNDQDGWYNIVYDYGGYVVDDVDGDGVKTCGLTTDGAKAAFDMIGKLCADVFCPQAMVAENGTDRLFLSNTVAMISQGSWMINSFYTSDDAENYGWAMLPYADVNGNGQADEGERCSIYNGLGWAAAANTKNPDAAASLIEWFSTEEMQLKQSELGVTMSGYIGCSDAFAGAFPGMNIDAFLKMETEGTLVFRPYSKYGIRWGAEIQKLLVNGWQDPAQMSAAVEESAAFVESVLAEEQE